MTTYRQDSSVRYKDEESNQILSVIENYNIALTLLDDYDHQCMKRPEGHKAAYVLTYKECRNIIDMMNFKTGSELFGNEKDDSFKGSIGNIYQTYDGEDVYQTLEEKAANLLYFITKNHSFSDGNKRIEFLYISFIRMVPYTIVMVIRNYLITLWPLLQLWWQNLELKKRK